MKIYFISISHRVINTTIRHVASSFENAYNDQSKYQRTQQNITDIVVDPGCRERACILVHNLPGENIYVPFPQASAQT
jgi:hypothetical protein